MAPFKAAINVKNKDLIHNIFREHNKEKLKGKLAVKCFLKFCIVRISNLIRFIAIKYIEFNPSRDYKKYVSKEKWIAVGKIVSQD